MIHNAPSNRPACAEPVTTECEATLLLRRGLGPATQQPVEALLARLRSEDPGWAERVTRQTLESCGATLDGLARNAPLDTLKAVKERCKRDASALEDGPARDATTLLYFLCVGAALARHGALLTAQPRAGVTHALADLASACPAPWRDLLESAAVAAAEGASSARGAR